MQQDQEDPDLVILDMMMPKARGFLVLQLALALLTTAVSPSPAVAVILCCKIMIAANEGSRHKATSATVRGGLCSDSMPLECWKDRSGKGLQRFRLSLTGRRSPVIARKLDIVGRPATKHTWNRYEVYKDTKTCWTRHRRSFPISGSHGVHVRA